MIKVGYIPYLNMVPFHQGFGPAPIKVSSEEILFKTSSPRVLGELAESGDVDAGALSLVDFMRLKDHFEPLGDFGVGVHREAKSVLCFSRMPLKEFEGTCAVTDETSTSVRLLQVLLQERYERQSVSLGRIASADLFDGGAEGLLLIGDEALKAKQQGIKGLPHVIDLGEEWYAWQGIPFVFARWAVRKNVSQTVKNSLYEYIEKSLMTMTKDITSLAKQESGRRGMAATEICEYWSAFAYRLTQEHETSIALFEEMVGKACLTVS